MLNVQIVLLLILGKTSPTLVKDQEPKLEDESKFLQLISELTNFMEKQEDSIAKHHNEVVNLLEKQSEMLALLVKSQSYDLNNSTKSKTVSSPQATGSANTKSVPSVTKTTPFDVVSPMPSVVTSSKSRKIIDPDQTKANWSYSGSWSESHPNCRKSNQSPINLETVKVVLKEHEKRPLFSFYDTINRDTAKLVNTGNFVTISLSATSSPLPSLSGGPLNTTSYHFKRAVFHWGANDSYGSEHTIRNITYPMEMQLIHQATVNGKQKRAIAAFLFEISEHENPFLNSIINNLANIQLPGSETPFNNINTDISPDSLDENSEVALEEPIESFSMEQLIQDSVSGPYFSYKGSLTFPPCTKVEQWIVFRVPLDISSGQMKQFRTLQQEGGNKMIDNFRPVQHLGKRSLSFTM